MFPLNYLFLNYESISLIAEGENERVVLTPENSPYSNDQFFPQSETCQWTHSQGSYQANMSANGLHLASETLLLVSLCLLDNIIHDLNLPAINE